MGTPPLFEPGLKTSADLRGRLRFTIDAAAAVDGAEIVWAAYDTLVDDYDRADVDYVIERTWIFPHLADGVAARVIAAGGNHAPARRAICLPSQHASYVPPGESAASKSHTAFRIRTASAGVLAEADRELTNWCSFLQRADRMDVAESAEMTKHALNAFLATSSLSSRNCRRVRAGRRRARKLNAASESERARPSRLLSPGQSLQRHLARDVFSGARAHAARRRLSWRAVKSSNESIDAGRSGRNSSPGRPRLHGGPGLTAPGTDTCRSTAIELCQWLVPAA